MRSFRNASRPRRRLIEFAGFCIVLGNAMCALPARSQSYSTESGLAEFRSRVPLHSFSGKSDRLTGVINLTDSTVDFFLDLETLKTGIGKRDKDMRRTLETDKSPFAEFYGKLISPFATELRGPQEAHVSGRFSVHGVTKDVEIAGTLTLIEDDLQLEAGWKLDLNDYAIAPPRFLVMKVDEIQEIQISATLVRVEK
jgi:polyisoprenoid-binding protein YceI